MPAACLLVALFVAGFIFPAEAQDAATLRARHAAMREKLINNQFQRPLYLESAQSGDQLRGEIYAAIEHPYSAVLTALRRLEHWCDILILHLNVKHCRASTDGARPTIMLAIGRKYDQPLEDAHRVQFSYRLAAASADDYMRLLLSTDAGPLGTYDLRILVEATSLDSRRTFLHTSYSYGYGMAARVAMLAYLATVGRNKVGFTIVRERSSGKPAYIDGLRGVIERNTMRYHLAIEAYLGAMTLPESEQLDNRLRGWYTAIERYPVQLHELERNEYLEMKRREVKRQQDAP